MEFVDNAFAAVMNANFQPARCSVGRRLAADELHSLSSSVGIGSTPPRRLTKAEARDALHVDSWRKAVRNYRKHEYSPSNSTEDVVILSSTTEQGFPVQDRTFRNLQKRCESGGSVVARNLNDPGRKLDNSSGKSELSEGEISHDSDAEEMPEKVAPPARAASGRKRPPLLLPSDLRPKAGKYSDPPTCHNTRNRTSASSVTPERPVSTDDQSSLPEIILDPDGSGSVQARGTEGRRSSEILPDLILESETDGDSAGSKHEHRALNTKGQRRRRRTNVGKAPETPSKESNYSRKRRSISSSTESEDDSSSSSSDSDYDVVYHRSIKNGSKHASRDHLNCSPGRKAGSPRKRTTLSAGVPKRRPSANDDSDCLDARKSPARSTLLSESPSVHSRNASARPMDPKSRCYKLSSNQDMPHQFYRPGSPEASPTKNLKKTPAKVRSPRKKRSSSPRPLQANDAFPSTPRKRPNKTSYGGQSQNTSVECQNTSVIVEIVELPEEEDHRVDPDPETLETEIVVDGTSDSDDYSYESYLQKLKTAALNSKKSTTHDRKGPVSVPAPSRRDSEVSEASSFAVDDIASCDSDVEIVAAECFRKFHSAILDLKNHRSFQAKPARSITEDKFGDNIVRAHQPLSASSSVVIISDEDVEVVRDAAPSVSPDTMVLSDRSGLSPPEVDQGANTQPELTPSGGINLIEEHADLRSSGGSPCSDTGTIRAESPRDIPSRREKRNASIERLVDCFHGSNPAALTSPEEISEHLNQREHDVSAENSADSRSSSRASAISRLAADSEEDRGSWVSYDSQKTDLRSRCTSFDSQRSARPTGADSGEIARAARAAALKGRKLGFAASSASTQRQKRESWIPWKSFKENKKSVGRGHGCDAPGGRNSGGNSRSSSRGGSSPGRCFVDDKSSGLQRSRTIDSLAKEIPCAVALDRLMSNFFGENDSDSTSPLPTNDPEMSSPSPRINRELSNSILEQKPTKAIQSLMASYFGNDQGRSRSRSPVTGPNDNENSAVEVPPPEAPSFSRDLQGPGPKIPLNTSLSISVEAPLKVSTSATVLQTDQRFPNLTIQLSPVDDSRVVRRTSGGTSVAKKIKANEITPKEVNKPTLEHDSGIDCGGPTADDENGCRGLFWQILDSAVLPKDSVHDDTAESEPRRPESELDIYGDFKMSVSANGELEYVPVKKVDKNKKMGLPWGTWQTLTTPASTEERGMSEEASPTLRPMDLEDFESDIFGWQDQSDPPPPLESPKFELDYNCAQKSPASDQISGENPTSLTDLSADSSQIWKNPENPNKPENESQENNPGLVRSENLTYLVGESEGRSSTALALERLQALVVESEKRKKSESRKRSHTERLESPSRNLSIKVINRAKRSVKIPSLKSGKLSNGSEEKSSKSEEKLRKVVKIPPVPKAPDWPEERVHRFRMPGKHASRRNLYTGLVLRINLFPYSRLVDLFANLTTCVCKMRRMAKSSPEVAPVNQPPRFVGRARAKPYSCQQQKGLGIADRKQSEIQLRNEGGWSNQKLRLKYSNTDLDHYYNEHGLLVTADSRAILLKNFEHLVNFQCWDSYLDKDTVKPLLDWVLGMADRRPISAADMAKLDEYCPQVTTRNRHYNMGTLQYFFDRLVKSSPAACRFYQEIYTLITDYAEAVHEDFADEPTAGGGPMRHGDRPRFASRTGTEFGPARFGVTRLPGCNVFGVPYRRQGPLIPTLLGTPAYPPFGGTFGDASLAHFQPPGPLPPQPLLANRFLPYGQPTYSWM